MAQYVLHRVLVIGLVFNNVHVRGGNPTIVHFCCLREFLDAHHFFLLAILPYRSLQYQDTLKDQDL